jgi:DNA polymerase III epsilon subunit-like protein
MRPWVAGEPAYVVGHNVVFDLGFLRGRCWATRTPIPSWLPGTFARTPRDFGCSMLAFAGFGGRISLDRLCRALGVSSPKAEGVDGSAVLDIWLAGEHERIARYCAADVRATRAVWEVMQGHYPADAPAAAQEVQA